LQALRAPVQTNRLAALPGNAHVWVQVNKDAYVQPCAAYLGAAVPGGEGPGEAHQPGPRRYTRSWIRDGATMSAALVRMGCTDEVRDFLAHDAARIEGGLDFARAGLSARELEVLRLAAEGRTNLEIGDALALSVRTVERHLSNAYDKLGVSGKAARAAAVARLVAQAAASPGTAPG